VRLWSLHPRWLDARGLVALWREGLLAQAVLRGQTRGYRRHPQLTRFRAQPDPAAALAAYLGPVLAEAGRRGYRFEAARLAAAGPVPLLPVTAGQLDYEWRHLAAKLARRDARAHQALLAAPGPEPHPLFVVVPGPVEPWEVIGETPA
jgi:hypothetical protein